VQEQLLTLVWRGSRIDHQVNDHDVAAGALVVVAGGASKMAEAG